MKYIRIIGLILLLTLACLPASGFKLYCDPEDWNGQWATNGTLYVDGEPTDQNFSEIMQLEVNGRTAKGVFGSGGSVSGEFPGGVASNFAGKWSRDGEEGTFNIQLQNQDKNCTYFEGWMTKEYGKREWRWRSEKYGVGAPLGPVVAPAGQKEGSCKDRSSEYLILVPGSTPPNCRYTCKDRSSENFEKATEVERSGEPPICEYLNCKKGFELDPVKFQECITCEKSCSIKVPNSIYDPTIQSSALCPCTCDKKNGYQIDENGSCIKLEDKIAEALLKNDPKTTAIAFLPLLLTGDSRDKKMAILTIMRCYPEWDKLPEHVKSVITNLITGNPSENFWIKQQFK